MARVLPCKTSSESASSDCRVGKGRWAACAAASSTASGMPSRRAQMSSTIGRCRSSIGPPPASATRSSNNRTASDVASAPSRTMRSPTTCRGSRVVVSTATAGQWSTIASTTSAAALSTCSQLSITSRTERRARKVTSSAIASSSRELHPHRVGDRLHDDAVDPRRRRGRRTRLPRAAGVGARAPRGRGGSCQHRPPRPGSRLDPGGRDRRSPPARRRGRPGSNGRSGTSRRPDRPPAGTADAVRVRRLGRGGPGDRSPSTT